MKSFIGKLTFSSKTNLLKQRLKLNLCSKGEVPSRHRIILVNKSGAKLDTVLFIKEIIYRNGELPIL